MQSVFEKHPLPWKLTALDGIKLGWWIVQDAANIRALPTPQIHEDEYLGAWREMIASLNALADIPNPAEWVREMKYAQEEYQSMLQELNELKNAAEKRIAELEQEKEAVYKELDDQLSSKVEGIAKAIHFFTGKSVSESDISDWSNGIDPTQPFDQ